MNFEQLETRDQINELQKRRLEFEISLAAIQELLCVEYRFGNISSAMDELRKELLIQLGSEEMDKNNG